MTTEDLEQKASELYNNIEYMFEHVREDVTSFRSPRQIILENIKKGLAELITWLNDEIVKIIDAKDQAYYERNQLVLALTKVYPSWRELHPDSEEWDEDWRNIIFIQLPTGQASWHIHDSELEDFEDLEFREGHSWDGHSTEEKYKRLKWIKRS